MRVWGGCARNEEQKNTTEDGTERILPYRKEPIVLRLHSTTHRIFNMKFASTLLILASFERSAYASLRGVNQNQVTQHEQLTNGFKCMFEGFNSAEKCADAVNDAGDPCSFCTVKADDSDEEVGICVDPTVAPSMHQMNPSLSCTNIDTVMVDVDTKEDLEQVEDFHDYKCTLKGFNDPDKCSHMHTDDGKHHCEYCTMDGPFGQQGVCVSPAHARELKHIAPAVTCKKDGTEAVAVADSNPIKDCNLSGVDEDTCLDPSKVNGSECIWCDAVIGGFCFPKDWSDKAGHFLTCKEREESKDTMLAIA